MGLYKRMEDAMAARMLLVCEKPIVAILTICKEMLKAHECNPDEFDVEKYIVQLKDWINTQGY